MHRPVEMPRVKFAGQSFYIAFWPRSNPVGRGIPDAPPAQCGPMRRPGVASVGAHLCVCPLARVSTNPWGATTSARHPPAGRPPGAGRFFGGGFAGFLSEAPPAPPTRPGHRFLSERKRWERKGRGCAPGVPQTGAHGGGWLYRQGKNRACIAARFMGSHVSGAVAPWVARIAVTPQALGTCALYRVRPPGRRRCHAPEKSWWFRVVVRMQFCT